MRYIHTYETILDIDNTIDDLLARANPGTFWLRKRTGEQSKLRQVESYLEQLDHAATTLPYQTLQDEARRRRDNHTTAISALLHNTLTTAAAVYNHRPGEETYDFLNETRHIYAKFMQQHLPDTYDDRATLDHVLTIANRGLPPAKQLTSTT
jgi:hypothetical protein